MLRLRAENKGLNLVFERPDEIPRYVHADEGKLRQILINLLGNAIKFTSEGKVAMRTRYKRDLSTHRLFFEVEDTGLGIGEDELENLFEAFGQTSSGRNSQEGTGLGLAISQEYVRLMDGEVTVSSQSGKGSVFSFDVRIELGDDSQVDQSQLSRKVVGLAPDQPVYRILVVEDKWENRKLLVKLLEPLGFQVREAENGQEGVRMWKEWEPQLIWMDMRMPVMDGYEATREIKDSQKGKDTVIIALTASAFEENRKVILSSGCDGFIRKPFRESELFDAMVEHLGVSFDYEEAGDPEEESTGLRETLGSDAFDHLTVDWITRLQSAATQADAELIANLTGELADEDSRLGEVLTNMVHDFRFDDIIALTGRQ
jgi:CheY-like chemotaxis protein